MLATVSVPTGFATSMTIGDLNGDGNDAVVVASAATGQIFVALQRPNDPLSATSWDYQLQVSPGISSIALADLSGGGLLDIVVTNQITGEVTILLNSKTDPFSSQLVFRSGSGLASVEQDSGLPQVESQDTPIAVVAGQFSGHAAPGPGCARRRYQPG